MKKKPIGKKYALLLSNFKHIFRLMKLTFLLFLLCISSVWANNANSQTTKVNIQAEKYAHEGYYQSDRVTNGLSICLQL